LKSQINEKKIVGFEPGSYCTKILKWRKN